MERVILRCLAKEPRDRPASVLSVAAALPGGDPLAAALAAGETPSPELVAEAGEVGGLSPPVAWACLAGLAVGVVLVVLLLGNSQFVAMVPLPKPPDVLAEKAREVIRGLGYMNQPLDNAFGFDFDADYLHYISRNDKSPSRWDRLKVGPPDALTYWYRQSPRYLVPYNDVRLRPTFDDPPTRVSGMVGVALSPEGRLRRLEAVPPERDDSKGPGPNPDWNLLFAAAGFDPAGFKQVEPLWSPPAYADSRGAWEGELPGEPAVPIRIEAAAYRGKPVSFRIVQPWTRPSGTEAPTESPWEKISQALAIVVVIAVFLGGLLIARRNLNLGRGDRKGASRLAIFVLAVAEVRWVINTTHVPESSEWDRFIVGLGINLFIASMVWVFYLALEPYLRRLWPEMIVSWVRLLDGRFRDPLVGRDVLIGLLAGVVFMLASHIFWLGARRLGMPPLRPDLLGGPPLELQMITLRGLRWWIGCLFNQAAGALVIPMIFTILLLLMRILLRRQSLAIVGVLIVFSLLNVSSADNPFLALAFSLVVGVLHLILLYRFGLLPVVVAEFFDVLVFTYPMTLDFSSWYAGSTALVLVVFAAMAVYGFSVSLAGRPIFRDALLRD